MNTPTATLWQHHPLGKIHFEPNKNMHLVCNPRENHSIAVAINENDARLIAAAPDLLAALQMVNRIWSHDQTANLAPDSPVAIVRAAIARATGGAA